MEASRKRKWQACMTVSGATLLIFPNGVTWYWGNLSILTLSFIASRLNQKSGIHTPWVISLYIIFRATGLIIYDFCKRICGFRCALILGIVISDAAMFSCYYAVQDSLLFFDIALGAFVGLGSGLLYGGALQAVVGVTDQHFGLLTCLIQGSFAAGAIVINEFVSLYANPNNLSPSLRLGPSMYFNERDVLDKVPAMFLYIGCFSLVSHIIAFILLSQTCVIYTQKHKDKMAAYSESHVTSVSEKDGRAETGFSHACKDNTSEHTDTGGPEGENDPKEFTPKQMLKTAQFYAFWFAFFVGDFPILLLSNYYKAFGQIWIQDDHFLTNIGSTTVFLNAWMRLIWGIVIEKLGVKNTFIVILVPLVLLNVWFYFSAMWSKWIYFASTFLFTTLAGALYGVFPAVIVMVYGKPHFSTNLGILTSATIVFNVVGPPVLEALLKNFGWFTVLTTSAILNLIGLLLLLKFVPRN